MGADSHKILVETLAECASPDQRFIAVARTALAETSPDSPCPTYLHAVRSAAAAVPPPFCTDDYASTYRAAAADARWLAISLMANAQREGQGATDLWSLAACAEDADEQRLVKQHSVDESRHAKLYLSLLDLTFPGVVDAQFRDELDAVSPGFSMRQALAPFPGSAYARNPSLDDYVQMNIAEIRTTLHHLMQREALALHAPPEHRDRARKVLDSLLVDELGHVTYTARLIEHKAAAVGQDRLDGLYARRLEDFNRITRKEFDDRIFE